MVQVKTKSITALEHVRDLLKQNRPQDALKFIEHLGQKTPALENLRGVCLMRLGRVKEAVAVLRDIVFREYVCMPSDTPVLYQINFATAMLLCNRKEGAFRILDALDERQYPQAANLKDATRRWYRGLNLLQKCCHRMGLYPDKPIAIDFSPGET